MNSRRETKTFIYTHLFLGAFASRIWNSQNKQNEYSLENIWHSLLHLKKGSRDSFRNLYRFGIHWIKMYEVKGRGTHRRTLRKLKSPSCVGEIWIYHKFYRCVHENDNPEWNVILKISFSFLQLLHNNFIVRFSFPYEIFSL